MYYRSLLFSFTILNSCLAASSEIICNLQVPPTIGINIDLRYPFILSSPCSINDPDTAVFIESTILNTDTGEIFVYHPKILDDSNSIPTGFYQLPLPVNYIAGIWITSNGQKFNIIDNSKTCFNFNDVFGSCNTRILLSNLRILSLDTLILDFNARQTYSELDCPIIRSVIFANQYQGIMTFVEYVININNVATVIQDNEGYLFEIFNKAVGCEIFKAPDLLNRNVMKNSFALNILDRKTDIEPISKNPLIKNDIVRMNYMRESLNYKNVTVINLKYDTYFFCGNMFDKTALYLYRHYSYLASTKSPNFLVANNLLNFLLNRYVKTWNYLNCTQIYSSNIPVILDYDQNNIVIGNNLKTIYENFTIPPDDISTQDNSTNDNSSQDNSENDNKMLIYLAYAILGLFIGLSIAIFLYFVSNKKTKVYDSGGLKKEDENTNAVVEINIVEKDCEIKDDIPLQLLSIDRYKLSIEEEREKNRNKLQERLMREKNKINF